MRQEFFKIIEEFLKLNERGYVESISKEKKLLRFNLRTSTWKRTG